MPAPVDPKEPPGRWRRALAAMGAALGLGTVFVASLAGSVVLHLGLPPLRRLVQTVTNDRLAEIFQGRIEAEEIDRLGLDGADIRGAQVLDPRGAVVVRATGIHARFDLGALAARALTGDAIHITVPRVRIDDAAVLVERGPGTSLPTLAEVFVQRHPKPPTPGARPVLLDLDRVEIGHAWVHGDIVPSRMLDADVSRVVAALHVSPAGVNVDVEQTGLADRALLPARLAGTANYHLRVDLPALVKKAAGEAVTATVIHMWTDFAGQLGDVQVQARAELADRRLTATAEIPRATPEEIATVLPGVPVREPFSAAIDLDGEIPTFSIHGRLGFPGEEGQGESAEISGGLDASGPARLELDFDARPFDLDILLPVTATPLDVSGRLRVELGNPLRFQADAFTSPFVMGKNLVPALDAHVTIDRGNVAGRVSAHEAGAPVQGVFSFTPRDGLRFEAEAQVASIHAVPRLTGPVDGAADVKVSGTLRGQALDARVSADLAGVRAPGGVTVERGGLTGHVGGSTAAPSALELDAKVWGKKLTAGGYAFAEARARARGPVLRPRLETTLLADPLRPGQSEDDPVADAVRASGVLDPRAGSLGEVKLQIRKQGTEVAGRVARVGKGAGGVAIEGLALEGKGVGTLSGGLVVRDQELVGRLHGEDVDLERVAKLAGVPYRVHGQADFDVDLQPTRRGRKGHIAVQLEGGEAAMLSGVSAHLTATFDDDRVQTDGLLRLIAHAAPGERPEDRCDGSIAELRVTGGDGSLEGHLLDPHAWQRISGKVGVAAEDWDLRCLSRLAPVSLFLSKVSGKLGVDASLERGPGARFPSIRALTARTRGLDLEGPRGLTDEEPAWKSPSIDVQVEAGVDGPSGQTTARVSLFDGDLLAEVSAEASLDLPGLVDRPKDRVAALRRTPISGHLTIPPRSMGSLASLPTFVRDRLPPLSGDLRVTGDLDGSVDKPTINLQATATGLSYGTTLGGVDVTPWTVPVDVETFATYEAGETKVDLHVKHEKKEIITGNGDLGLDLSDVLAGATPKWSGGIFAKLTDMPLGELPLFADHDVGGHVSGTVSISGLHARPRVEVSLQAPDLQVGQDVFFDHGSLKIDAAEPSGEAGDHASARVQAELGSQDGGSLGASAFAGLVWKDGLVPEIDQTTRALLYAKANHFRLAAFQPAVADMLSKLDGLLDGDARVSWTRLAEGEHAQIEAQMKVTDGVVNVPQLGQELHDMTMTIHSKPDGDLALDDLRALGAEGRIVGKGTAHLEGLVFKSAEATLEIPRGEEIPLTLEGVPVGNAWGQIKLAAEKVNREVHATLGIPELHLELPPDAGRSVQPLDDNPSIRIKPALHARKEPRSPDALAWILTLDIGRVDVASNNMELSVTSSKASPPMIELLPPAPRKPGEAAAVEGMDKPLEGVRVSGDVELLPGGTIQFFGKQFVIEERGLVRLRPEDASNPYLNVKARWLAPDGTRVFVEYSGVLKPITSDKLKLTADPALSAAQIQALLLGGGDVSGGSAATWAQTGVAAQLTPQATAQQAAGGVATELASRQVSQLLAGTIFRGLSTQFTTDDSGTLRPGVTYALGDKLYVVATFDSGTTSGTASTAGGSTLGGTASSKSTSRAQFSLDWRFLPSWLLQGNVVVGEQPATGLDLLWQYRY